MFDVFMLVLSVLVGSFYLLLKSSDYLVSSSSALGEKAGISPFVIGLTLIAIGTSLPELFTGVFGILFSEGSSFVLGTVIGSNISNILLIFSLLLILSKKFSLTLDKKDILFFVGSVISLLGIILLGFVPPVIGVVLLIAFVFYMYLCVKFSPKEDFIEEAKDAESDVKAYSNAILFLIFLSSLIGLNLAARGVVFSIEELGVLFSLPLEFLTLTTVAFATSLPELVVTYSAVKKNSQSLAVGNLVGSNISNILLIVGFSGVLGFFMGKPLVFSTVSYLPSMFFLILSSVLFLSLFYKKFIHRWLGYSFLVLYFVYLILIF